MKFNGKDITELLALNRRNFLKLVIGGAVGTGLTPIPWKLADDSAIFTQNFPWVPVPETGEFWTTKSVCKLCPGGCGIEVRKVEDRAVKIEGRTDYPVNPGGICPVGMGGLQLLYNEQCRFTDPMKRIGPRGSGTFVKITWDEALDTLSNRISDLQEKGTPEALMTVDGNPADSTMALMAEQLTKGIGSPNYMRVQSSEDTYKTASMLMQGTKNIAAYDLENSDYILSFGSGLLEGWGSAGRILNAWNLWKSNDTQIVHIDSKASNTASKADRWIPAKPGTETALALGIAHVMITEELYDKEFVDKNSSGFADWTSSDKTEHEGFRSLVLKEYSPETVSEITGVPEDMISEIANDFANAEAPVAICGKGKGALSGNLFEFMAVQALNALAGSINRSGGVMIHDPLPLGQLPEIKPVKKERLDKAGSDSFPFSDSLFKNAAKEILEQKKSPIDTLLIFSSNPAFTLPDGGDFKRAMEKIPFIVSFSPYHDESALMADLVLPDHNYLEKMDDMVWPSGLQYPLYGITQPVVEPLYNTKNSGDTILEIAGKMGGPLSEAFPWESYEEVLEMRARGLFKSLNGITEYDESTPIWEMIKDGEETSPDDSDADEMWESLKENGLWFRPDNPVKELAGLFTTPTKKFEFYSNSIALAAKKASLKELGITATGDAAFMPHYEHGKDHNEGSSHSTLQMIPYEMLNLASGWIPSPPYLYKTIFDNQLFKNESFVEINPETAKEHHLHNGDRVTLESHKGKIQARINIFEGAMPGMVYMPMGFGHTAYDDFQHDKGANPNEIIDGGRDPLSGQPAWCATPVKLIKV